MEIAKFIKEIYRSPDVLFASWINNISIKMNVVEDLDCNDIIDEFFFKKFQEDNFLKVKI